MSTQRKVKPVDEALERQVVKYLRIHPDFFERHQELLGNLRLPHQSGDAVSLIERQISILREQNKKVQSQLNRLVENAQVNEDLIERINALILTLLDADSLDTVLDIIENRLSQDFNADAVVIRLFNTGHPAIVRHPEVMDWSEPALGAFEKVIAGRKPICGRLKPGQLESLFNDDAGNIGSAALIPLVENGNNSTCYGMLAIGSHDHHRFRSDMGTLFLKHMGDVLARVLRLHLEKY